MGKEAGANSRRRWLTIGVLAVLMVSAIATSVVVERVVQDQERRLLDERAAEAGALLSTSFGTITATLPILGAVSTAAPDLFDQLAKGVARGAGWTGTATTTADGLVVGKAAGDGPTAGVPLNGERAALFTRALSATGLVSDVFEDGGQRRLAFAVATGLDRSTVIAQEFAFDPAALQQTNRNSPFSELEAVVYAGATADPDRLLFATTSDLPVTGTIAREVVPIGTAKWLLVVKAKHPLVGTFAHNSPTYVFAFGMLTALLIAALVDMISRRRVYALALVDERTMELRDALQAKVRLEEGQRVAREAAEAANRSKSEFLSRMSHELRTPLNAVLGFAQLLEIEDLSESDHDSVRQIIKGGRHLLDLINEVLDITRIESGTFQLSPEPVLAGEVLADTIELTRPLAVQAGIHLITGTQGGCDAHVLADRQRLKQILLNLVSNAIKYNRPGGTVALSCEAAAPNRLRIKVRDTGPGIRPEHLELLFTPFERLGAEHTNIEGSGIGLALSRRLAEALGGTLDVETTLGQGTTFWVELPVVEGPVERYERLNSRGAATATAPPVARRPSRKILYIEDNISNLRLVQRILERDGDIELVSAMQGQLGLELAREHQPELILLDLHLPDVTGDEVLRQLRDDPQTGSIPVVVLSADATAGQIQRLLSEGARAYLTKPLDVAELRGLVDSLPNPIS
jgi:signal transduction histidine kinase/CheY-like chemotaxis protein